MSFGVTDPRFDAPPSEPPPADHGQLSDGEPGGGRGCFFWGCLTLAIVFLTLLIGVPLAAYFTLKHYVSKYTADAPLKIAVVELPEKEMQALEARFEAFEASMKKGAEPQDLEVSAKELNALIGKDPDLKGHVLVRIADGRVGGDVSIPMDELPGGAGRHLNATVDFDVSMVGGVVVVTLADARVNGAPLPPPIMKGLSGQNLAKDIYKDPENAEVLRKFESLEIVGDKIILKARKQPVEALVAPPDAAPIAPEIESMEEAEAPAPN